jgi:hypothetical protein
MNTLEKETEMGVHYKLKIKENSENIWSNVWTGSKWPSGRAPVIKATNISSYIRNEKTLAQPSDNKLVKDCAPLR